MHVRSIHAYKIHVASPERDQVGNQELDCRIRLELFYGDNNYVMDFFSFPEIVSWNRHSHITLTHFQIR
jgi:hypothetical protein